MNNQDDQLHRLLQQWKGIEPPANFDTQVWRRIRQAGTSRAQRDAEGEGGNPEHASTFADWLRGWLPQPAFALAAAVIVGAVIGASSGLFSAPLPGGLGLLAPDTLAGTYVRLTQR